MRQGKGRAFEGGSSKEPSGGPGLACAQAGDALPRHWASWVGLPPSGQGGGFLDTAATQGERRVPPATCLWVLLTTGEGTAWCPHVSSAG